MIEGDRHHHRHDKSERHHRSDRKLKKERTDRHVNDGNNHHRKNYSHHSSPGKCSVEGCTNIGTNTPGGMCSRCFHTLNTRNEKNHRRLKDKHNSFGISRYLYSVFEKQQKISLDNLQHQILQYSKEKHIRYSPENFLSILEETGLVEVKDGFAYALPRPPLEEIKATIRAFVTVYPNQRVSGLHRFLCEFYKIDNFRQLGQGKIIPFLLSLGYDLSQLKIIHNPHQSLPELIDLYAAQHDSIMLPQLVAYFEDLWGAKVFLKLFQTNSFFTYLTKNGWLVDEKTGEMRKIPKPGEEELIRMIIEWRNSAVGVIIGIDDLEDYLTKNLSHPFCTLGYGSLEDFLKHNHFTVMAVNKKLFFNPPKNSETPCDTPSDKLETAGGSTHSSEEEEEDDSELCKICMERPLDCVVLICGHLCMCCECAAQFSQCPICRQCYTKQHIVKVFKS